MGHCTWVLSGTRVGHCAWVLPGTRVGHCARVLPSDGKQLNRVGGKDGRVDIGTGGKALVLLATRGEIIPTIDVSSTAECVVARL